MARSFTIDDAIISTILTEARDKYPLETGGIFLGLEAGNYLHVTHQIGPGPNARHRPRSFEADAVWQNKVMADLYQASNRSLHYLGDWHTHPDATDGNLSLQDRRRLKQISTNASSRQSWPIMGVLYGGELCWSLNVVRLIPDRTWLDRLFPQVASIHAIDVLDHT